jgi:hypothetical protein
MGAGGDEGDLRVSVGKDKSVAVEPLGVLCAEVHVSGPEDMGGRSHTLFMSLIPRYGTSGLTIGAPG